MSNISTGSTSIAFGATLRIGYRVNGSSSAYTYITSYPSFNDLPYIYTISTPGVYEIEYTAICPSCSMPEYSASQTTIVTVS